MMNTCKNCKHDIIRFWGQWKHHYPNAACKVPEPLYTESSKDGSA